MDRKQWLKTLKPGDKVANETTTGIKNEKCYEFLEIKNITRKGNIRLTNGILLNENGYYHKNENWSSWTYNIEPITKEIKNRREYNNYLHEVSELCDTFRRKKYELEDLKFLKEILERGKEK